MNQKRYERRSDKDGADTAVEKAENTNGVLTETPKPVMTQFDAFEDRARQIALDAERPDNLTRDPIETRDNRGADDLDNDGSTKPRIPIYEIDGLAEESAREYSKDLIRVVSRAEGNDLVVTVVTQHGSSTATAAVGDWTAAGVKKALKEIRGKITGEIDSGSDEPKDKLAEAVREVAKS